MTASKLFSLKTVTTSSRVALAATFLMMASAASSVASASTCVWTGASSGSWSTAGNWSGCAGSVPVNGDTLQFPEAAANKSTTHNLNTLTTVAGLAFTGTTSGYTLAGNALTLAAGGIANANTSGTNMLSVNLSLASNQAFAGSTGAMLLTGNLNLGNQQLGIDWSGVGGASVPWTINGNIVGAGGITVTGTNAGTGLILAGGNTFSGAVALVSGYTQIVSTNALGLADGTAANGTSIGAGATLVMGTNISIGNEALVLGSGSGQNGNGMIQNRGTSNWGGPVQLTGNGTSYVTSIVAGTLLDFSGPVTGTGGFQFGFEANSIYRLSNPGNTFAGNVKTNPPFGATIRLGNDNVIPDTAAVILQGNSTFDLNGKDDTVAALQCTASDKVIIPFGSALTVGDNTATMCAGVISGAFSSAPFTALTKVGSGTLTLTAINTYPGEVDVLGGGMQVTGELIPDPASAIFVSSGQNAALFGTGTVGNVVTAGIVHGGSASTPGTLSTDKLTFNGVGILSARIATAVSYDRIKAADVVISPNATLAITLGYVPIAGTTFTLIENLGSASVQGQFSGLPQGATLNVNGIPFVVSYVGGDGNDITMTAGSGAAPPSVLYTPPTGTAPVLSASGIGSIAATATNFGPSSTVSISGCAVTPSSPAFPANAVMVVNPTFASPNGSIGIACAPQASATSGTLSCNESFTPIIAPTVRSWPITCPAAIIVGVAPTAALAASSVGLINGVGSVGVNVLTSGVAVGSLNLNCSIPPGAANFQITSASQRLIDAPAILGANAPAIGLSCVEQATVQSSMLSCAQTANPGPDPAPLTALVTCRGATPPPPPPVVPSLPVPTMSLSGAVLLILTMLALVANFSRKAKLMLKKS